jgi:anti-anti-sigma factor
MPSDHMFDVQSDGRFSLLVSPDDGTDTDATQVILSGEVDALSADLLTETVADILSRRRPRRVEIDLDGVTFLDSAGIKAMLRCHADAQQADCRLALTAPRAMVYRVLEITGLLEHFGVQAIQLSGGSRQAWPVRDRLL